MKNKSHWEQFFDGHAPGYLNNAVTKNTIAEVDFVLEELKLPAGSKILDMGCGAGRHSVELARRGCAVTGVDLSAGMLAVAAKAAERPVSPGWAGERARLCAHGTSHLAALGRYDVQQLWGGTAGKWGRHSVELDEIEIMAVALKS